MYGFLTHDGLEFYGLMQYVFNRTVVGNYGLNAIWVKHRVPFVA